MKTLWILVVAASLSISAAVAKPPDEKASAQLASVKKTEQVQKDAALKRANPQAKAEMHKPEPLSRDEVLGDLSVRLAEVTQGS